MENIKKRETMSIFELDGRKFEINSYDPMEGNYILSQIITFVLPFGLSDAISGAFGAGTEKHVGKSGAVMSKTDFINLQIDILKNVNEIYETGNKSPVVRENGTYGVTDVSMNLLLQLLIASIAFNFKDFFKEGPLSKTFTQGLNMMSASTKM